MYFALQTSSDTEGWDVNPFNRIAISFVSHFFALIRSHSHKQEFWCWIIQNTFHKGRNRLDVGATVWIVDRCYSSTNACMILWGPLSWFNILNYLHRKKRDICWQKTIIVLLPQVNDKPKDTDSSATTEKRQSVWQWPQLTSSWFLLDDVRRSRKSCRGEGEQTSKTETEESDGWTAGKESAQRKKRKQKKRVSNLKRDGQDVRKQQTMRHRKTRKVRWEESQMAQLFIRN